MNRIGVEWTKRAMEEVVGAVISEEGPQVVDWGRLVVQFYSGASLDVVLSTQECARLTELHLRDPARVRQEEQAVQLTAIQQDEGWYRVLVSSFHVSDIERVSWREAEVLTHQADPALVAERLGTDQEATTKDPACDSVEVTHVPS